jgi:hypothetical protein
MQKNDLLEQRPTQAANGSKRESYTIYFLPFAGTAEGYFKSQRKRGELFSFKRDVSCGRQAQMRDKARMSDYESLSLKIIAGLTFIDCSRFCIFR